MYKMREQVSLTRLTRDALSLYLRCRGFFIGCFMARIRTIKPEFFTSEDIVSLTPLARVFYIALWCEADREGRLDWKPGTLKMRYLPGDNCDFQALANELISAGLVVLYEVDGKTYAEIPTFKTHQVINNRETESTRPARVKAEGKGRERKREGKEEERKEGEPRKRDAAPIQDMPADVEPQTWADWLQLRKAKRAPVTLTVVNGARAEAEKAGMTLDAFLQVWCRRGSQGLEAGWLKPDERLTPSRVVPISFAQQDEQARRRRWEEMTGRKWPESGEVVTFDLAESETPLLEQRCL